MERKCGIKNEHHCDMTMWMFDEHPRYDYHLKQFAKRYELECREHIRYQTENEKDKSQELVLT